MTVVLIPRHQGRNVPSLRALVGLLSFHCTLDSENERTRATFASARILFRFRSTNLLEVVQV